jgi:hypothetical protein
MEEINLMCIFDASTKQRLISDLLGAAKDLYDPELREISKNAIKKLSKISDDDFYSLDLYPEYGDYDESEV